jgi:hypothetical protein
MKLNTKLALLLSYVFLFLNYTIKANAMEDKKTLVGDMTAVQTARKTMKDCWKAVSEGNYDSAYSCFIDTLKNGTLGGFVFEAVVNGLVMFEYLPSFDVNVKEDTVSKECLNSLIALEKEKFLHVFRVIDYIIHNQDSMPSHTINECFKYVKVSDGVVEKFNEK